MIAVLGGGITALAAALELKQAGKDFILLEGSDSLGGKIQSREVDGYQIELGPNTVLVNNPETKEFLERLDLYNQRIEPEAEAIKRRFVLKEGKIEAIPYSLSSAWTSKLFGFRSLLAILREPLRKASKKEGEESLADFSRRRFGKQIYEDLLTPFVSGIYAGDPEKMSVNYTLSILKEAEAKYGSVIKGMPKLIKARKAKWGVFEPPKQKIFSFEGGLSRMIKEVEVRIGPDLKLNCQIKGVESLDEGEERYLIRYLENGTENSLKVDRIISCLPAGNLREIIKDLAPKLNDLLKKINYVPALVSHFAFDKSQWKFNQRAFGLLSRKAEQVPFLGVLFNSEFFPHQSKNDDLLLTVISGGYRQPELLDKSDDEVGDILIGSLQKLGLIEGDPKMKHYMRWKNAIPQYELGYLEVEQEIKRFLSREEYFKIGGNFFNGISVSDCIANGTKLARQS